MKSSLIDSCEVVRLDASHADSDVMAAAVSLYIHILPHLGKKHARNTVYGRTRLTTVIYRKEEAVLEELLGKTDTELAHEREELERKSVAYFTESDEHTADRPNISKASSSETSSFSFDPDHVESASSESNNESSEEEEEEDDEEEEDEESSSSSEDESIHNLQAQLAKNSIAPRALSPTLSGIERRVALEEDVIRAVNAESKFRKILPCGRISAKARIVAAATYERLTAADGTPFVNILLIGVRLKYQREGLGTILLSYILDDIRIASARVAVTYADETSIPFWRKYGFLSDRVLTSKYEDCIENWESSVLMLRYLAPPLLSPTTASAVHGAAAYDLDSRIDQWKASRYTAYQQDLHVVESMRAEILSLRSRLAVTAKEASLKDEMLRSANSQIAHMSERMKLLSTISHVSKKVKTLVDSQMYPEDRDYHEVSALLRNALRRKYASEMASIEIDETPCYFFRATVPSAVYETVNQHVSQLKAKLQSGERFVELRLFYSCEDVEQLATILTHGFSKSDLRSRTGWFTQALPFSVVPHPTSSCAVVASVFLGRMETSDADRVHHTYTAVSEGHDSVLVLAGSAFSEDEDDEDEDEAEEGEVRHREDNQFVVFHVCQALPLYGIMLHSCDNDDDGFSL
jgi:ribosomal protein S18 acetylase RimI-like enzyme